MWCVFRCAQVVEAAELSHLLTAGPRARLLLCSSCAAHDHDRTAELQSRLLAASQQHHSPHACCLRAVTHQQTHWLLIGCSVIPSASFQPKWILSSLEYVCTYTCMCINVSDYLLINGNNQFNSALERDLNNLCVLFQWLTIQQIAKKQCNYLNHCKYDCKYMQVTTPQHCLHVTCKCAVLLLQRMVMCKIITSLQNLGNETFLTFLALRRFNHTNKVADIWCI